MKNYDLLSIKFIDLSQVCFVFLAVTNVLPFGLYISSVTSWETDVRKDCFFPWCVEHHAGKRKLYQGCYEI